jgi:cytochrome b561
MLNEITYYLIFGLPLIAYLGMVTLFFFLLTALIASLRRKGKIKLPVQWHYRFAYLSIILGLLHFFLSITSYI